MNMYKPQLTDYIVALDIGTTKVCAVVGRKTEYGKLEILGVGRVESTGVSRGVVSNIERTVKAIADAIAAAEARANVKITDVFVGIAGQHIKSLQHSGMVTREAIQEEISRRDIDRLINDMSRLVLPPGDRILHVIPQEYTVDNEQGILDPIGMSGIRLEANFHIVTGQDTAIKNIYRCIERANYRVANLTLEPIASAAAVLSDEEKEAGVVLVDIGGGTTDIAIFYEGIIRHTAVIPFGGNVITKDIKTGCSIMQHQAESLKVKFGSALAEGLIDNRIFGIPGLKGHDPKEISERNLAMIIEARMEEIIDRVYYEIRQSGFERKLIGGIVLTGGGALLNDLTKLFELGTGMVTRVGFPIDHLAHGYTEEVCSPVYATSIGLLIKGYEDLDAGRVQLTNSINATLDDETLDHEHPSNATPASGSFLANIFGAVKNFFEAEPDRDI